MRPRATKRMKREPQEVGLREASHIISALQNIMANSRIKIPDLETSYSTLPNSPIPPHERSIIGAIITKRRQQLRAVSREISSLETLFKEMQDLSQQLIEKENKIVDSLALHEGRASSVWCLPNEVLSQIFVHCLPVRIEDFSPLATTLSPLLLARVCRRWRDVAVNLPSLWCRLCVKTKGGHISDSYGTWLQRSRGHPVSLWVMGHVTSQFIQSLSNLQSPLRPYLKQVSSLHVYDCRTIAPLIKDLSSIQELVILNTPRVNLGALGQSLFDHTSSTLRSLRFTRESTVTLTQLHHFHHLLAYLTNLEITVLYEPNFGRLFEIGCNLSSLTISLSTLFQKLQPNDRDPGCGVPHTHAKLQSLFIVDSGGYRADAPFPIVFNALTLPNLCVLEVSCQDPPTRSAVDCLWDHTWPHEEFKNFLTRSKCPLRRLALFSGRRVAEEQIAEYRALVPSLLEVVVVPSGRRRRR